MPLPTLVRIAAAQYPIGRPASLTDWAETQGRWVAEAASSGAELLVFPEYALMELAAIDGDAVAGDVVRSLAAIARLSDDIDAVYRALACRHGVHILAPSGPVAIEGRGYVNVARFVSPTGAIGYAQKQIMTPFEREWGVSPGAWLDVFETTLGRIGVAICYDSEFPLLVRALVEAGAVIVLVPSCTDQRSGAARVAIAARARALESQIATVVAPTVGEALWSATVDRNTGAAGVYLPAEAGLPEAGILAQGQSDVPGWTFASVDLAVLARVRAAGEMRNALDWGLQPGVAPLAAAVGVVDLRG